MQACSLRLEKFDMHQDINEQHDFELGPASAGHKRDMWIQKLKFSIKDYGQEFYFICNWDRATIQEKLWLRMKFKQTAKVHANCV